MNVVYLVFSIGLLLSGACGLASAVRDYLRGWEAKNWPTVNGVVTATRISKTQGRRGPPLYYPVILYRYEVGGADYECDRLALGFEVRYGSESRAEEFLQIHPVGSTVQVRYDVERPSESVLLPGSSVRYLLVRVIVSMAVGGMGVWIFLIWRVMAK